MSNYTSNGRRQDLEEIAVNAPEGYIGNIIFPAMPTAVKAGTAYFKTLVADAAAQTDRTEGTAPTATLIGDSSQAFSCGERIKRYSVPESRVVQFGGIEAADKAGAMASKRSVLRSLETAQAEALLAVTANDVGADFLGAVLAGKAATKRYAGKLSLVCSKTCLETIMGLTDVVARLARFTAVQPADNEQILALDAKLLAMVCGVEQVLVGDDDHWAHTTGGSVDLSLRAAIVKVPDAADFSQDMDPILGKTYTYNTEGKIFTIDSVGDLTAKANFYDAQMWDSIEVFNASAAYVLGGIDGL